MTVLPQFKLHMNRSSMHEINTNEHQNIFYLNRGKTSMHNCKKSTEVNIFFDLICLSDKMADSSLWLVRSSVSQALCEWSITKCWVQVGAILLPDGAYPLKSPPPPPPFCSICQRDQTRIIYRYIIYDAHHTSKNSPAADRHQTLADTHGYCRDSRSNAPLKRAHAASEGITKSL